MSFLLKSFKFLGKVVGFYILGFIIAIIVFAFVSKYMKSKQYSKEEFRSIDLSTYNFVGIDSTIIEMNSFKGKFVLVEFWFSGCKPCLNAMASLTELADDNPNELVICSISIEGLTNMNQFISTKRKEGDFRFIDRENWKFINIIGHEELINELKLRVYPIYFILDKDGVIIKRFYLMPKLEIKKYLSTGASLGDYIEGYRSVMPCGGLKKYLIAYSIALFIPGFLFYILIMGIVLIVKKLRNKNTLPNT